MNINDFIDTNTTGNRCDVTPLFLDHNKYIQVIDSLVKQVKGTEYDIVAGIDALGFILGTSISHSLRCGFLAIRKGGKLPVETLTESFVDYTKAQKSLEIRIDSIMPGQRVILVDEWIETGSQVSAAISLIERSGGQVVKIVTINADVNDTTRYLDSKYEIIYP